MSVISAGTTLTTALVQTGDTNGNLVFKTGASGTTALTLGSDQSATFAGAVSFGTSAFGAGSASAPSITFTGDTNTGIYSPAADTIAFTEGGVESMRITSAGNVGIGTGSPSQRLHVASAGTTAIQIQNTASSGSAYLTNTNTVTTCSFGVDASGGYIETAGAYSTIFYTNSAERMRIDSSGSLLIGTTTGAAGRKLVIGAGSIRIDSDYQIEWGGSTVGLYGHGANNTLHFFTNTTERMRITSSGNVGIGTTSPDKQLSIGGFSSGTLGFVWTGDNTSKAGIEVNHNTGEVRYTAFTNYFPTFYSSNAERMRIDTSGNLLVGTTSAQYSFSGRGSIEVNGSSEAILGMSRAGSASAYLYSNASDLRLVNVNNTPMQFWTNNTERIRISNGGEFLVGTTTNVLVSGNATKVAIVYPGGFAQYGLALRPNTDNTTAIVFCRADGAAVVGSISQTSSATSYNTSSDYRLKENIAPMTGALEKVAQLKPCTYTWKETGKDGQGFIAHELQEVVPDAVVGEKDAVNEDGSIKPQGIDTSFLVATLTAAIQEQQAIINDLTTRLTALENK